MPDQHFDEVLQAIKNNDVNCILDLLSHDPTLINQTDDTYQCTILMWSTILKNEPIAIQLIEHNNTVNQTCKINRNVIHYAARNGLVKILAKVAEKNFPELIQLQCGQDSEGNTPLHLAAREGASNAIAWLLKHGAVTDTLNNLQHTPLALAIKNLHGNAIRILLNFTGYVEITENNTLEICCLKLIRTLLYQAKHDYNAWDAGVCKDIRNILNWFDVKFASYNADMFLSYLVKKQKAYGSYFGSYLSDNSDDDEEEKIPSTRLSNEKNVVDMSLAHKKTKKDLFIARLSDSAIERDLKRAPSQRFKFINLPERRYLSRSIDKADKEALERINAAIAEKRQPISEDLIRFSVIKYRGINYFETKWNRRSRKAHQRQVEIGLPYYSEAVLKISDLNYYSDYEKIMSDDNAPGIFHANARNLKSHLVALANGTYSVRPQINTRAAYLQDNLLTSMQVDYSKGIKEHQARISDQRAQDEILQKLLPNHYNARVSCSDFPYHALRYAFCLKDYYATDFIYPYWDKHGRSERPYLGKVYCSAHPISDFLSGDKPLNIEQMTFNGDANVERVIGAERETAFPAYIKKDRIYFHQVARVPAFNKPYKSVYLKKYGLTEGDYNAFMAAFKKDTFQLHSPERNHVERLLLEWLVAYAEVTLLTAANQHLLDDKKILVYQNSKGGFSFEPPSIAVLETGEQDRITNDQKNRIIIGSFLSPTIPNKTEKKNGHGTSEVTPEDLVKLEKSPSTPLEVKNAIKNVLTGSSKKPFTKMSDIKTRKFFPSRKLEDSFNLAAFFQPVPDAKLNDKDGVEVIDKIKLAELLGQFKQFEEKSSDAPHAKMSLSKEAKSYGFECSDVPKDGRCFFHAMLEQLYVRKILTSEIINTSTLIERALAHIINHIKYYSSFDITSPDDLISRLMKPGEWADHLMIQALARTFKINIVIIYSDGRNPFILKTGSSHPAIFLGYEINLHYQSLLTGTLKASKNIYSNIENAPVDDFEMELLAAGLQSEVSISIS